MAVPKVACGRCSVAASDLSEPIKELVIGCQYDMREVSRDMVPNQHNNRFTIPICRDCRTKLLKGLHAFFNIPDDTTPGSVDMAQAGMRLVKLMGSDEMWVDDEEYKALKESGLVPMD